MKQGDLSTLEISHEYEYPQKSQPSLFRYTFQIESEEL